MLSFQDETLVVSPFGILDKDCDSKVLSLRDCESLFACSSHSSDTAISQTSKSCPKQLLSNNPLEFDFNSLQQSITHVLQMNVQSPLPELTSLFNAYSSNPEHWSLFAHAEPSKQYTRNLVFEVPGIFNLLLLVWSPGKSSPVHDHADSHCLMKILKGDLKEERYSFPTELRPKEPLLKIAESIFNLNQVAYISDELGLHRISNPSNTDYAVSLHLYFPPNAALKGCHVYDLKNGGTRHVIQDTYDSVHGDVMTNR